MEIKTVGVACDHAGYPLKKYVLQYLEEKGYPYKDYGTWSDASVDYPDFGHALAEGIESGEVYNVLVMPGRFIDNNTAKQILDEFFKTTFEGGRHQKRVDKIAIK